MEIRFLEINSNFLEDIGLDIDFFLNLGNAGFDRTGETDDITRRQILQPRENPGPWNRTTPFPVTQDSAVFTTPGSTGLPGSLGGGSAPTAFIVSGSFLDNVQVDFLMRATQAHQRSKQLTAPHITVMNGEEATFFFGVNQPYVSELRAVTDNRVGLFEPTTANASTGVSMVLSPTMTVDKRYVILGIEVQQTNVLGFQEFAFNVAGEAGTDTTDDDAVTPSASTASTGIMQQPITEENMLQTRIMVPDGGTLLLGGQKRTGEIEKEMGVPALSKIPLISRLFSNRSTVQDESIILILIKPQIILPQEEEELRFGSFENASSLRR